MEVSVRYLQEDPKTGILRYRRTFPKRIRAYVGKPGEALTELKISLGVRSITEPGAMERYAAAAQQYEIMAARAEKLAVGAYDALDAPTIAYLVEVYRVRELAEDADLRFDQPLKLGAR